MKHQDLSINQVSVSIIANIIRDKFAGIMDFKPYAQFSDLFIFKSQSRTPRANYFNLPHAHGQKADINERQFELIKRRLKGEIEAVTGFVVSTLEFVDGTKQSQFLIMALEPMIPVKRTRSHQLIIADK